MNAHRFMSFLLSALLLLGGCRGDPASPIISGEVRALGANRPLSERQVKLLNSWLQDHGVRRGCSYCVSVSDPRSSLLVGVIRQNGEAGTIAFFSEPEGWRNALNYRGVQNGRMINWQASFDLEALIALRQDLELPQ
jgi:hypothetical protein